MREVQRKLNADQAAVAASGAPANEPGNAKALSDLAMWLQRAERIRTQQRNSKNKLYALHAPEVECISKGKARNPYEFGVKVSLVVTHKQGLMVGARSFPGNPYDGHVLSAQLEQTRNLLQDLGRSPKQAIVDLGYRGVDADNPGVQIIHRGKYKSLTDHEKRLLKRRQAIEPLIGHTKSDHRMDRCWLQGATGDALHALSCAAGYNIRWLLRAIVRLGLHGLFYALSAVLACLACLRTPSRVGADKTGKAGPITTAPALIQYPVAVTCWAQMNSAGPTNYGLVSNGPEGLRLHHARAPGRREARRVG